MRVLLRALALATLALSGPALAQTPVTTPDAHLGRKLGKDFTLADWKEVSTYFKRLAKQSPRVLVERVGTTTEGREFLLATISSEKNLKNLDAIRAQAKKIADPRGLTKAEKQKLVREGKVILFISCAMHSTETAAPQFGMAFAHKLATSDQEPWRSAREKLVVLVAPTLNPDGLDEVVSWYRKTVGTPHEGARLKRLYQLYAGHDNNRDWFSLTQAETRIVTRLLYSTWRPQIYWDVHQQGSKRERFFLPPYRDPLNHNLDPAIIAGLDAIGSRALLDMTRAGFSGISTGVTYDMWWNGGNRNVPVRHNIIGILTEAASVNLASPMFLPKKDLLPPRGLPSYRPSNRFPNPWPGGWWRIRHIIDYELAFGRSLLGTLTREPHTWLGNALEAAERAIAKGRTGSPRAWLIPSDQPNRGGVRRLVDGLLLGGVELYASKTPVEADGRRYPKGTIVIPRDQPYGAHVQDLFELQRYPKGAPPYDVAGWTLPLLFGVRRVAATQGPDVKELTRAPTAEKAILGFPGVTIGPGAVNSRDSDTWRKVFQDLAAKRAATFHTTSGYPGHWILNKRGSGAVVDRIPRIGVYSPWRPSMDEGWLRWVLDSRQVPYQRIRNAALRAGKLRDHIDVLILPSIRPESIDRGRAAGSLPPAFAGGLDPEGAVAVEEFVREGGRLIALGASTTWARDLFKLPLDDVARGEPKPVPGKQPAPVTPKSPPFSCPGSVLRTIPEPHVLTKGLPSSLPVFFSRSHAWKVRPEPAAKGAPKPAKPAKTPTKTAPKIEILLRYAPTRVLLSGWIQSPDVIAGQPAWLRVKHGRGHVHLFGFRPQYRGWSEAAFQLLFRAILLGGIS